MNMSSMESNKSKGRTAFESTTQEGESVTTIKLNALAKSVHVKQSCAILIVNHHTQLELVSPKRYLYSGLCEIPPPPVIKPGIREICLYRKKFGSIIYGTAGLLTFDIKKVGTGDGRKEKDGQSLYLMWSVPSGFGTNYHAVGINKNEDPSYQIFTTMYNKSHTWYHRETANNAVEFEAEAYGIPIKVVASISSNGNASWKIDFY